nr:uncharacterized protein LOC104094650 [Nicotiana tomentosiformis]
MAETSSFWYFRTCGGETTCAGLHVRKVYRKSGVGRYTRGTTGAKRDRRGGQDSAGAHSQVRRHRGVIGLHISALFSAQADVQVRAQAPQSNNNEILVEKIQGIQLEVHLWGPKHTRTPVKETYHNKGLQLKVQEEINPLQVVDNSSLSSIRGNSPNMVGDSFEQRQVSEDEENEEYAECNSTDEEELLRTFAPRTSWHQPDPDDEKNDEEHPKYFRFLDFWIEQIGFNNVKEAWSTHFEGNALWKVQQKLKTVNKSLSQWSKNVLRDIFDIAKVLEKKIEEEDNKLQQDDNENTRMHLNKLKAEYILHIKKGRRKRLFLHRIKGEDNQWIEGEEDISEAAIEYYEKCFSQEAQRIDLQFIDLIPKMITEEDNNSLINMPSKEEVKQVNFDIDRGSTGGPDGFNGRFFQQTWDIIEEDIYNMVLEVMNGRELSKFITHTCLVLIPKVENPQSFFELRPISLSNVTQTIITKLLNNKFSRLLPKIIFPNQSEFIKGRAIRENVLLAQDIISSINQKNTGNNVLIKLDMNKAYDRISWMFLCGVLRKMGFAEQWIHTVWNLISNVWYSILINDKREGFFKSARGLKQGDSLSPSLFIITVEALSKVLNNLHENSDFSGFTMNKKGPQINHLAYTDDLIIFISGNTKSLRLIKHMLAEYEKASGQQGQLLSPGGKAILIKHVLSSISMHLLSICQPPKTMLKMLERFFANFFWGQADGSKKYHWASWRKLCYPTEEGGMGFRNLSDTTKAFTAKIWWLFRTNKSLWVSFLLTKYCSIIHLVPRK